MSQTLYRKYRPKNFSEVIGQAHIVRTLSNAVKNNRVGQAYLFTGPRGTGKTSIARILAKTLNCENLKEAVTCEKCKACQLISENKTLDIIEIDAASNTGVDNIRELRETVALPPTALKYKVYIIDEVHMLSTGAFNALLKTLEEPPSHVIFILATTEIHKVPETILSRCQRFDFSRLPIQNIIEKLELIAKAEKVKIDRESLEMIAIAAEGGMRDAESLLGQIISLEDKNITKKEVEEILGTTDKSAVEDAAVLIIEEKSAEAIRNVNTLLEDGYDLQVFNKSLISYFRQLMLLKVDESLKASFVYELTSEKMKEMIELSKKADLRKIIYTIQLLLDAQNKISSFILPQLPLEIAIIKATGKLPAVKNTQHETHDMKHEETQNLKNESPKKHYATQKTEENVILREKPGEYTTTQSPEKDAETTVPAGQDSLFDLDQVRSNWNRFLVEIRPLNHSLCALLSTCEVRALSGREIVFATPYDFYQEKLNDPKNRLTIEEVLGKILECEVRTKTIWDKDMTPKNLDGQSNGCDLKESEKESVQDSLLGSALEILGGKVVEE